MDFRTSVTLQQLKQRSKGAQDLWLDVLHVVQKQGICTLPILDLAHFEHLVFIAVLGVFVYC